MNVNNDIDQWSHILDSGIKALKEAKKRQGQKPRDRNSKEMAYIKHMMMLEVTRKKTQINPHTFHASWFPLAYPPCIKPLAELKQIMVRDLQLEIHHRGTYILLRSITPPCRLTAITIVMEDEHGDVVVVQLHQQDDEKVRAATDIVDVGTVMLVKEPFFKASADGDYSLRVDHVSDLEVLKVEDTRLPMKWQPRVADVDRSSDILKINGNEAMKSMKYWQAIQMYVHFLAG